MKSEILQPTEVRTVTNSRKREINDYAHDMVALEMAMEKYKDNPQGYRVLSILYLATESALQKLQGIIPEKVAK